MKLERIKLTDIKPYKNNAKIHTPEQIGQLIESIEKAGFNDPIAVDENNVIIEGHGRFMAVQQMGWTEVDCLRLDGMTDEQKRFYIHVHNQLTMNTGFDLDILEAELKSLEGFADMGFFGFDMDFAIDSDFSFDDGEKAQAELQAAAAAKEPRARKGDLWQLGRHRLIVGDSTHAANVDRLTGGAAMDLCVTDPPYNVDYVGKTADALMIQNDNMDEDSFFKFLKKSAQETLRILKPGGSFYVFHADRYSLLFRAALRAAGGELRQTLIWVKNSMVLGRQDYQWKHEPILYGWKDGASHYFVNDRCQTTVFENQVDLESMTREELLQYAVGIRAKMESILTSVVKHDRPSRSALHPTMKPVALCAKLIQNSSKRGENVFDPFGGSGSVLMACEETGRNCYTAELDPVYADVIINRWEEATGEKAVLLNGHK